MLFSSTPSSSHKKTSSFTKLTPSRPHFNTQLTSDRLREGSIMRQPPFKVGGKLCKGRKSVFKEVGLDDDLGCDAPTPSRPSLKLQEASFSEEDRRVFGELTGLRQTSSPPNVNEEDGAGIKRSDSSASSSRRHQRQSSLQSKPWYAKIPGPPSRPRIKTTSAAPPASTSGLHRFTLIAMLIAVVLPALTYRNGQSSVGLNGADAGVVHRRDKSPVDVCTRWAHSVAFLNGTLYIYGGEASSSPDQESNTWNNNFLTLDLTKDWETDSPALTGQTIPDGPPAVSLGSLWHDYNNLYLYGGEFSSTPYVDPAPESVWKYSIASGEWSEMANPKTSAGNYSEPADEPVHRAAEGSGISVPELGLSWYFGGHLDWATTPGWSKQTDRVYLQSLLEFTHPGYVNTGVYDLSAGTGADEEGAFRNITQGGVQANDFPERADGVLIFVPGWGPSGVLIGLAGGTADKFTHDLGTLDVYDIASSKWFHQKTSGDTPGVRVNPCAVVASASDASSFQIYMFGGQNLQPAGEQTQYNDMYILTIPSFTWIKVDQSDQDVPEPRAGHTCTLQDSQMVVVGGFLGKGKPCDSPGVYVFDTSSLQWKNSFKAASHDSDFDADNFVLAGSYGYSVPNAVQSVIGGGHGGGATATQPAAGAGTDGPFATGKSPVVTVTDSASTATVTLGDSPTETAASDSHSGGGSSGSDHGSGSGATRAGLISAGVVAGIAGALAIYLGFCAWLYRRQVRAYRQHLAAVNRYSGASAGSLDPTAALFATQRRGDDRMSSRSSEMEEQHYGGWMGSEYEPAWLADSRWVSEESPGTANATHGSGSGSAPKHSEDTRPDSDDSSESADALLSGQEPSFFSVVMGPRRALRVVNGIE